MPQPVDGRFEIVSDYQPAGDQPRAIKGIAAALERGESDVCLLGVTGSGKTFTMANLIAEVQRPTLVMGAEQDAGRATGRGVPGVLSPQRR